MGERAGIVAVADESAPGSRNLDGHIMVGDLLIPSSEGHPRSVFDHRPLIVLAGKTAHGVQPSEDSDRGEHDLGVDLTAQKASADKAGDQAQMLADLALVVALVVVSMQTTG